MLVGKLGIKYIIDIEVHVVGCLYIMDLINARKMEHMNEQSGSMKCGEFLDLLKTG